MKTTSYFLFILSLCNLFSGCTMRMPNNYNNVSLANTKHLDHLYVPVTFPGGVHAGAIYIYAEAPDYHVVGAKDEGFTCVDDVSRAALVYLRNKDFASDTAIQSKAKNLIHFILEMQSPNGYFYNFLADSNRINKDGQTSVNTANWWSWRALQALTESGQIIKKLDTTLAKQIDRAVDKLIVKIKEDLINQPHKTKLVNGITVPSWLPAGSATDQSAILILGLLQYDQINNDPVLSGYIRKLADGILMLQQGDSMHFPYSAFLSWENVWHAYGNDQAYALMKAAAFFKDTMYMQRALKEVNNFYPWLLTNGFKSSFSLNKQGNSFQIMEDKNYSQIAYGIRPMVFAAAEAYAVTNNQKYADLAGHLASWIFGGNEAHATMYDSTSGRCFDGILSKDSVNYNSGAESTIEALLLLQKAEQFPAIITAIKKYRSNENVH